MYTGIVQSCRPIGSVEKKEGLYTFTIEFPDELLQELETGASVAVNGVWLRRDGAESEAVYATEWESDMVFGIHDRWWRLHSPPLAR